MPTRPRPGGGNSEKRAPRGVNACRPRRPLPPGARSLPSPSQEVSPCLAPFTAWGNVCVGGERLLPRPHPSHPASESGSRRGRRRNPRCGRGDRAPACGDSDRPRLLPPCRLPVPLRLRTCARSRTGPSGPPARVCRRPRATARPAPRSRVTCLPPPPPARTALAPPPARPRPPAPGPRRQDSDAAPGASAAQPKPGSSSRPGGRVAPRVTGPGHRRAPHLSESVGRMAAC
jgi:hypothetical protein